MFEFKIYFIKNVVAVLAEIMWKLYVTVFCCREVGTGLKKIEFRPNAIGSFRTDISHLALLHLSLILVSPLPFMVNNLPPPL